MRILGLPVNFVKFSIGSKRSLILAVAVVSVMIILLAVSILVAKRSSAHSVSPTKKKQHGCCGGEPAIPRRMIGTYHTTEDGFQSTLVLNNKGPNQIMVTPIIHSQSGQTFTASPVAVGGQSSSEVDLNLLASIAGPQFRSGSFGFTYEGRILEVGGGLRIVNVEKSLIFDEQMLEPGMKFPSSQLEAVYAVPFEDSQISVIVTNTTAQPIIVNGDAIFAGTNGHHPIQSQLGPHETQVIKLPHGLVKRASAGAVSLNHNGDKGALLAMIHLQDADRGYSEAVNFTNPGGKTNERHGAGLRLGSVDNDPLRAMIAVRNIGESATTVTATVPYSKRNGETGTISLPQVSLAPGEIKLLNTSNPRLRRNDFATAGLEIKYTGAPGGVIATASSVSQSGNHVFTLPMKDPQSGLSSTGGYPWFISGSSSTVVFIKNTTNEARTFSLNLVYAGGQWGSGHKTIAPGQTFKLDMREVRDSQMKGSAGNAIPLDAVSGHVNWSVRGKGGNKTLIGRAQTVDFSNGLASTYECQQCCPRNFYDSRLEPGIVSGFPGDQQQFLPVERTEDCHGNIWDWDGPNASVFFNSDDWSIATISPGGLGTAIAPGSTTLRASWESVRYFKDPNGTCFEEPVPTECTSFCDVQCQIPSTEVTNTGGWHTELLNRTKFQWNVALAPFSIDFAGRQVTERDPPGSQGGNDTCWFPESNLEKFNKVTGSTWTVRSGNNWGPDTIGYSIAHVEKYRTTTGRVPCGTRFTQQMLINCGSEKRQYKEQQVGADIKPGPDPTKPTVVSLTSTRAGLTSPSKIWP